MESVGQFQYFDDKITSHLIYISELPNIWNLDTDAVISLTTRIGAKNIELYKTVNKNEVEQDNIISKLNYNGYQKEIKDELVNEENHRRSQVLGQLRSNKMQLSDVIATMNKIASDKVTSDGRLGKYNPQIIPKAKSPRGRKATSLRSKLDSASDNNKTVNVSNIKENGTGTIPINPPSGKSGKVKFNSLINMSSNNKEGYLMALDILKLEYEQDGDIFHVYDGLVEWAMSAWN